MPRLPLLVAFCAVAAAQDVAILKQGDLHIQGFGAFTLLGGVNVVSTTAVSPGLSPVALLTPNTNGSIGAQADYFFTRRLGLEGGYSYLAGGTLSFNQDYFVAQPELQSRRVAVDAHSSARIGELLLIYRIAPERSPRLAPYFGAGVGLMRTHFELRQAVIGREPGNTFSGSFHDNDLMASLAFGTRYYFTERLGISGDLRFSAGPNVRTMSRVNIGFFFKVR